MDFVIKLDCVFKCIVCIGNVCVLLVLVMFVCSIADIVCRDSLGGCCAEFVK